MADVFEPARRSVVMSQIRGKNNRNTELRLLKLFRAEHIIGWRRHQAIFGRPDFVFRKERVAIFVDGCFWHGCPSCYISPKTRAEFWRNKIKKNRRRDKIVSHQLKKDSWRVDRIWECDLKKNPASVLSKLRIMLSKQK